MTLATRTGLRPCGKRFATEDEALHSKKFLAGGYEAWPCRYGCKGFHLKDLAKLEADIARAQARATHAPGDTGPDRKTKLAVYERDGWACACCGESVIGRPHSVGHRKRRSQGGGHGMSNLLTFLGMGNGLAADDHHFRIDSRANPADEVYGYTVRSGGNPALIRVMFAGGDGRAPFWAWPGDDGSLSLDGPAEAAA